MIFLSSLGCLLLLRCFFVSTPTSEHARGRCTRTGEGKKSIERELAREIVLQCEYKLRGQRIVSRAKLGNELYESPERYTF